ncbi:acyltransferase family protein [Euryhalocaulis caribicus]|uniref:acyltransferase family protein n=1 Tax=Euryhalocaulis caribicus TaxID=1161401 RepID=UPI00039C872E|nr:acyltransferase [Euryhalocaulis caribicus]
MRQKTIGNSATTRDNFFTPIRLCLAGAVALSHSWIVFSGRSAPDPFAYNDLTLSYMAVNGFFILSGFFIAKSLDDRQNLTSYFVSRALRIMPALLVLAAAAAFIIGPVTSGVPIWEALFRADTYRYPLNVISFLDTRGGPPGFAPANPYSGEFSGSLWTLRYEVIAYAAAAGAFALSLLFRRWVILGFLIFGCVSFIYLTRAGVPAFLPDSTWLFNRLGIAFLIGCAAYAWRHWIPLRFDLALLITLPALFVDYRAESEIFANLALGYWLFLIGTAHAPRFNGLKRIDDISYGLYIWHWPVMQLLLWKGIIDQPLHMAVTAIPLAILIGFASWTLIEKPALHQKSRFSKLLKQAAFFLGARLFNPTQKSALHHTR